MREFRDMKVGKSGYRGVSIQRGRSYVAMDWEGSRKKYIGCFSTAFEAARAYDFYMWCRYGDAAILNFPPLNQKRKRDASLLRIAYVVSQKGRKSAGMLAKELGISRNSVVGHWHRHSKANGSGYARTR